MREPLPRRAERAPVRARRLLVHALVTAAACLVMVSERRAWAAPWSDRVQDELFCLRLADAAERAALPLPIAAASASAHVTYWEDEPAAEADRWLRYMLALAMLSHFADRANDQSLHAELEIEIAALARRDAWAPPLLRRQLHRCALAHLIAAAVERQERVRAGDVARLLALEYSPTAADSLGSAVEDLPLIEGLRALSLLPPKDVAPLLAGAGILRAEALAKTQPARASRLLAETARLVLASGDAKRAWGLATRSNEQRGKRTSSPRESWRNFPVQYQVQKREHGQASADRLAAAMLEMSPLGPGSFGDAELESDVYFSLSDSAGARQQYERAAEWWRKSREAVYGKARRGVVPMSFFHEAIARSTRLSQAADRRAMIDAWQLDPGSARRDYEHTYRPLLAKTQVLVRNTALSDVRAQILVSDQVDRRTSVLHALYEQLPAQRMEIADTAFQMGQLRDFDKLAPATVNAFLARQKLDPALRGDLQRILSYQVTPSLGLRNLWGRLHSATPIAAEQIALTREAWLTLNVLYNETGPALGAFIASVGKTNPALAAMLGPMPWSLNTIQQLLAETEALVALQSTEYGLFVWALTRSAIAFERAELSPEAVSALAERLRKSMLARPSSEGQCLEVPPFDAAAAHALYANTLGRVSSLLPAGTHLLWHPSGPALAAVPPAVLLERKPPRDMVRSAAELRELSWVGESYPISVLPDPSVWILQRGTRPSARRQRDFLGVGAPVSAPAKARPQEVRGLTVVDAEPAAKRVPCPPEPEFPPLPEAEPELRALARLFPAPNTTLLLGASATRPEVTRRLSEGAAVIAFATHGLVAGELGLSEPGLLLSPPPGGTAQNAILTATDVATASASSDLVILSACNTAASDGRPRGDAFSGLTTSFIHAGARAVLVSHWPVASDASARISTSTLEHMRKGGESPAESLRLTMRAMRLAKTGRCAEATAHPFYWAPFVLVGDGARPISASTGG